MPSATMAVSRLCEEEHLARCQIFVAKTCQREVKAELNHITKECGSLDSTEHTPRLWYTIAHGHTGRKVGGGRD